MTAALAITGCYSKPRYERGDHLIPLGSSDPNQIVTVVSAEKDSYQVSLGQTTAGPTETRTRKEIDSDYVRVADLPVGGSWLTPTPTPMPSPTVGATATPTPLPSVTATTPTPIPLDAAQLAASVRPALVRISVFGGNDKLARTGTGFFLSADGRLVTTSKLFDGAAKAVAELPSGAIKNITGLLAFSQPADLALAKADINGAPFINLSANTHPQPGQQVAVIASGARGREAAAASATVKALRSDAGGEALQLTGQSLRTTAGAPVMDAGGEVVGVVTADEQGDSISSIRSISALAPLLGQIQPATTPSWPGRSPTPTATPKSLRPTPAAKPEATLVYTPYPRYPAAAKFSYFGPQGGSGVFAIDFGADGAAYRVEVLKSTGVALLDQAALDALKSWRAQRGQASRKVVPVTFKRP